MSKRWIPCRDGQRRRRGALIVAPLLATSLAGCGRVRPQEDFARTRELISATTGLTEIYDPAAPLMTEDERDALLEDGLTLAEALRVTLLNNRRLHAEFMSIGVAKADWVQAGLLSNPTLALSVQFPEGGGRSNLQASIAQNIVDLWQIPKRKQLARADLNETVLRIAHLATTLAADTRAAYVRAAAAQASLALARENLEATGKSHAAVQAQREAGTASPLDENLARGPLLSAQIELRNARLALVNAKRSLASLMSLGVVLDDVELADPLPDRPVDVPDPQTLIDRARKNRLDLRALQRAIESRQARLGLERRSVIPEISLGPAFERLERRALPGRTVGADAARASLANLAPTAPDIQSATERDAARREEIDTIFGAALGMTLPVFDQNRAQITKARYLYRQQCKLYEALYLQVAQEVLMAADRALNALANTNDYRNELVPQARKNLEFATASYEAGHTSILTLLEAQRALLEARKQQIAAQREAAVALSDLDQATGGRD